MKKSIFILSCVFVITLLAGFVSAERWTQNLNEGLLSYWKLDDVSGEVVDSAGRNNGTNNGANRGVNGIINNSFNFDGNGYVDLSTTNPAFDTSTFSISFWFNSSGYGGESYFFDKREFNALNDRSAFFIITLGGELYAFVQTAGSGERWARTSGQVSPGTLYHGVVTYDMSALKLYINGQIVNAVSATGELRNREVDSFVMGRIWRDGFPGRFLNGNIDEVGMWNRSLTDSEVLQLYNNGNGITYIPIPPTCTDADGDGYYANCSPYDCNDNNSLINPDLVPCREFECLDRIDNDLDGFTDKSDQDCSQLQCQLPIFSTAGEG